MKKFLSALLAVVMVVAMLPAGIAFAADGDNADIVFDFATAAKSVSDDLLQASQFSYYFSDATHGDAIKSYMPSGISLSAIGAPGSIIAWQARAGNFGLRYLNHRTNWESYVCGSKSETATDSTHNRFAFDITIDEDQAGWYRPVVDFSVKVNGELFSIYIISGTEVKYLGERDATYVTGEEMNPVYLGKGTHTLLLGCRYPRLKTDGSYDTNSSHTYIKQITLKAVNETPVIVNSSVVAPKTLVAGEKGTVDGSTLAVSDDVGTFDFAIYAADAATGKSLGASTVDYMDVTSSDPYIAAVTKVDAVTHTVSAISAGTVTLTVTPVVGGVKQTAMATTKTLNVTGDILIDAGELPHATYANIMAAEGHPTYWKADATNGQSWGWNKSATSTMGIETAVNANWDADSTKSRRVALDVTVPEDGWYLPSYKADAEDPLKASVYSVVDGSSFYLGDLDLTGTVHKTGTPVVFNPVYLKSGDFANKFYFNFREGTNGANFYFNEFKLTKLNAAPTATELKTNIPVLSIGEEVALTAKVELSTGKNLNFENAMATSNGGKDINPASFKDYMTITSDNASVVKVSGVSASEFMNAQNYKYTLTALKSGTANITFTPYVAGVAQTPIVKTVTVAHPNAEITDKDVSIALTAIVDGVVSPDAKLLLSESTVTAGIINSVTIGSTVTLKAKDSETLKFLYWYNGNSGRMISDAATYTFTAGTNTPIFAKYADVNEELTEYFSTAGQLMEKDKGTFDAEPNRKLGDYYKLFKDKTAGVASTLVNETSDAANFVCWKKNNEIVSYDSTYSFWTWADVTDAVEVTEGEKSDVPAVVLFENAGAYMLELVNFEGKTIIEKGILFGGNLTVSSCEEKAVALEDTKQFTASPKNATTARAYVIYRDGATIRVAYSK